MGEVMNLYRKGAEQLMAATQIANETAQAVARRNVEFLRDNMETTMNAGREIMTTKAPDQNAAKLAELNKQTMQKSVEQLREVSEMVSKSQLEAFDKVSTGFTQTVEEATKMAKKAA